MVPTTNTFLSLWMILLYALKHFVITLNEKYKLKLKGVGPTSYHLGCGYTQDEDGTLQENMLPKSLSPMKRCYEKNQRRLEHH